MKRVVAVLILIAVATAVYYLWPIAAPPLPWSKTLAAYPRHGDGVTTATTAETNATYDSPIPPKLLAALEVELLANGYSRRCGRLGVAYTRHDFLTSEGFVILAQNKVYVRADRRKWPFP